jgi:hypothetical protein
VSGLGRAGAVRWMVAVGLNGTSPVYTKTPMGTTRNPYRAAFCKVTPRRTGW